MRTSLRLLTLGVLSALTLTAAQPAKAGILLEPYLGYELGKLTTEGSPDFTSDWSSANLGARVGFTFPMLFVAADYSLLVGGSLKDTSSSAKADLSGSQLFLEVGANLPIIRAFVGYGLLNTATASYQGVDTKYEGGTAIKAGVGASVAPLVALNLEYIYSNYDKTGGNSSTKSHSNVFMLDVSLPFDL